MKLSTYISRILILAMGLTLTTIAYSQEKKTKVIDKKTVVTGKKVQKAERAAKTGQKKASTEKKPQQRNLTVKKPQSPKERNSRFIALKTNVPFDVLAIQNLALEFEVHKHITIDIPVMWSISDIEREHGLRTIALQPEVRWWLKSATDEGHFFGLHIHAAWFNLKWNDNRYQTEKRPLVGAGVSYGYRWNLGNHWGAEFNLGFGYANMKYNTYYNIENGAYIDTRLRNYWGITRAGLSLVYRF